MPCQVECGNLSGNELIRNSSGNTSSKSSFWKQRTTQKETISLLIFRPLDAWMLAERKGHETQMDCLFIFVLYVASGKEKNKKTGLPRKFVHFVLSRPIKKRSVEPLVVCFGSLPNRS